MSRWRRELVRFTVVFAMSATAVWIVTDWNLNRLEQGTTLRSPAANETASPDMPIESAVCAIATVLDAYLDNAITLRLRSDNPDLAADTDRARDELRDIVRRFTPASVIDCEHVIPRPNKPRPKEPS